MKYSILLCVYMCLRLFGRFRAYSCPSNTLSPVYYNMRYVYNTWHHDLLTVDPIDFPTHKYIYTKTSSLRISMYDKHSTSTISYRYGSTTWNCTDMIILVRQRSRVTAWITGHVPQVYYIGRRHCDGIRRGNKLKHIVDLTGWVFSFLYRPK